MSINYPNGEKAIEKQPIKKKKVNLKKSHLGTSFEDALNDSNAYYQKENIAIIHKKPTPIQVVKVEYPSRNKARISEAYYKIPSTTDYNGIYRGSYIDFEAKSCHDKRFSFHHIYKHQIEHLINVRKLGAIAFLLIEFSLYNEVYLLPIEDLTKLYQESLQGGAKSIAYETFKELGTSVKISYIPRVDYLKAIDERYFKNE